MGRSVSIFVAFLLAAVVLPGCAGAQAVPPPARNDATAVSTSDLLQQAAGRDAHVAANVPSLFPALAAASRHPDAAIRRSAVTALVRTSRDGDRFVFTWGRHGSARVPSAANAHSYSYRWPPPTAPTHEEHFAPGFAGATFFIAIIALRAVIGGKRRRPTNTRRVPSARRQPPRRPPPVAATTTRCPRCQKIMPTPAAYCRRCGLPLRVIV